MFAGANIKCLSYAAFFGYFLGGARKYRLRQENKNGTRSSGAIPF